MTYCVGLDLKDGMVLLSDTRTNAGVDNISTFSKMHVFEKKGDRVIVLLAAGNLASTQAVVNLLNEGIEIDGKVRTFATVKTMFRGGEEGGARGGGWGRGDPAGLGHRRKVDGGSQRLVRCLFPAGRPDQER